jgi:DUF4097 and DUF4098 domain-containing protein YvlB
MTQPPKATHVFDIEITERPARRPLRRLAGGAAFFLLPLVLFAAAPAQAHRLEKTFTVDGRPVITLRNAQGKIQVKSWKRSEVVIIADHASPRVEVDAEQRGNQIELVTHLLDENVGPSELTADYQISVPEESELQIKNDSGSVYVERVYGDMTIDTVKATVEVQEISGYLAVKTMEGSFLCRRCAGHIDFSSISGSAQLLQPLSSNVKMQTNTGDLLFDGDFLRGGTYSLKNMSGTITVRFSENDSLNLSATSVNGKVENQANLTPETHRSAHLPGKFAYSLAGTMNQGLARVELTSFSGTIRIHKRD